MPETQVNKQLQNKSGLIFNINNTGAGKDRGR